jgi:hypothetical protein
VFIFNIILYYDSVFYYIILYYIVLYYLRKDFLDTSPALETRNCLAHAVGPPMISVLSSAFGYSFDDNPEHSHELNLERARALGKAPERGFHRVSRRL